MCARFQIALTGPELTERFGGPIHATDAHHAASLPRYDVRPTDQAPVLLAGSEEPGFRWLRWGFPAPWLSREGRDSWSRPIINARSEEAHQRTLWAQPLRQQRGLLPTTGFIEWLRAGPPARPTRYPLRFSGARGTLGLAVLWQEFAHPSGTRTCFAILTTAANPSFARVHDRMPVILPPRAWAAWLDPQTPAPTLRRWLRAPASGSLRARPLHRSINRRGPHGAEVMQADWRIAEVAPALLPDRSRASGRPDGAQNGEIRGGEVQAGGHTRGANAR